MLTVSNGLIMSSANVIVDCCIILHELCQLPSPEIVARFDKAGLPLQNTPSTRTTMMKNLEAEFYRQIPFLA